LSDAERDLMALLIPAQGRAARDAPADATQSRLSSVCP